MLSRWFQPPELPESVDEIFSSMLDHAFKSYDCTAPGLQHFSVVLFIMLIQGTLLNSTFIWWCLFLTVILQKELCRYFFSHALSAIYLQKRSDGPLLASV